MFSLFFPLIQAVGDHLLPKKQKSKNLNTESNLWKEEIKDHSLKSVKLQKQIENQLNLYCEQASWRSFDVKCNCF